MLESMRPDLTCIDAGCTVLMEAATCPACERSRGSKLGKNAPTLQASLLSREHLPFGILDYPITLNSDRPLKVAMESFA